MPDVEHEVKWLSVSKIGTFMKCPKQAHYRYVLKAPEPSFGNMIAGRVVHAVLEKALKEVIGGRPLPSVQDVDDFYEPIWRESFKEEEERDNFVTLQWDPDDKEQKVFEESRALVRLAREEVLPKIKPSLVEHNMNFDLDANGSGPFRVYGVVDLYEHDTVVSDWKTTTKVSPNAKKLDIQFCGYAVWHQLHTGCEVMPCRKIFLVRGKRPKVEETRYQVTPKHREWFTSVAAEVWKMVKGGGFVPNTSTWACSEKWCSFWNICQGEL